MKQQRPDDTGELASHLSIPPELTPNRGSNRQPSWRCRVAALLVVATTLLSSAATLHADLTITIFGTPGTGESYWKFEGSSSSEWRSNNIRSNQLYRFDGTGAFPVIVGDFFHAPGGAIAPVAKVGGAEVYAFRKEPSLFVLSVSGLDCESECLKTVEGNGETRILYRDITGITPGMHTLGDTTFNVIYCTSGDSDGDGIPDDCDQCPGSDDWDDWDHNGVPDACELDVPYSNRFAQLGTVCNGQSLYMNGQSYFPSASGDVTITCTMDTNGVAAADANVEVYGNGVLLGTLFEGEFTGGCAQSTSITVSSVVWEAARQPNGGMQIELRASSSAVCGSCSGFSLTFVDIAYMADRDVNDNGIVDVRPGDCDPTGPDADGDGVGDACDLCPGTAAGTPVDGDGCTLAPTNADLDRDGDVDNSDMNGFFNCAGGPESSAGVGCSTFDLNSDGAVDLVDFLVLQDAASGAGVAAEATSGGTPLPRYFGADIGHAVSLDNASRMCQVRFGSTLAMIDPQLTIEEQQSRVDEMTALANGLGGGGYWIGLRYDHLTQRFKWRDGSTLIPEGDDAINWWNGQTPTASDFSSGNDTYYVFMWGDNEYKWLNTRDDEFLPSFDPTGCMCDAPDVFGQGMPAGEEGGDDILNIQIISNGNISILVGPGDTVTYEVIGALDNADNEGLAGFAFDLSFDGGDLSPGTVPVGMENFAAPLGYNNSVGFGGTVVNGDLIQVGGGQNTITYDRPDGPTGTVSTGIGQSTAILATGTFVAPTTLGTYTLSLSNLNATTINAGQPGTPVWRCEPALPGTITNLTVIVCDGGDADHDGICDDTDLCITANDDCGEAAPIGDETVFGCTSGATNDGFASCGSSHFSPDVWYIYTAAFDGTAIADTCAGGTDFNSVLSVYDGCGGTQIICDDDGCGFPSESSRVTWDIVAGQQYLIRVAGWFGAIGNFELTTSSTPYPSNDDCEGAIAISGGSYVGSTGDAKLEPTGPCGTQWNRDIWFAYTNTVGVDVELLVDLCNPGTTADTILAAYDECGGAEIVCNDNAGVCTSNGFASSVNWVVPCGQTHLIRVATNASRPGNEFELTMSEFPVGQDSDGDGVGDGCDVCPGFDDNIDSDGDGFADGCDNCVDTSNPDQADGDPPRPELSPVAAWHFDEGNGAATDTVFGHVGTLNNGAVWSPNGRRGTAIEFPVGGGTVNVSGSAALNTPDQLSVSLWVKPTAFPANINRFVTRSSFVFRLQGGKPHFYVRQSGNFFGAQANELIDANQWTHLAAVWDGLGGGLLRIYINGVEASTYDFQQAVAAPIDSSSAGLTIGNAAFEPFEGLMDELAIFSRALTATEIQGLVANGLGDGFGDACDLCMGDDSSGDVDNDGVCDNLDVCMGFDDSIDTNGNGIPDGCELPCGNSSLGDVDGNGTVSVDDIAVFVAVLIDPTLATTDELCSADVNLDGSVDGIDIQSFMVLLLVQ